MQFCYFVSGKRKGPIDAAQLKTLAASGVIAEETEVEYDGRRVQARKIKGLTFKSETSKAQVEKANDAGEIYGVAAPVAPSIIAPEPTVSAKMEEGAPEVLRVAPGPATSETQVPPVDVPIPEPSASRSIPSAETPSKKGGKFGVNVVLFALSGVFLALALVSALVGFAQLRKIKTTLVLAPSAERFDELENERINRLKDLAEDSPSTESSLLALNSLLWQTRAIHDARRRPSISAEAYIDALNRLDFDKHEFVGGDAYNYEVNASLFTGLGVLGVGADVRDVGSVVAAGAGFVCAALFASTSALLLALGLLARRTSAV